jgi:hypothetical protein
MIAATFSFLFALSIILITTSVQAAESYPSGGNGATIWEFVNCVENSNGLQFETAIRWDNGNPPTGTGGPNAYYSVVWGGSYYWEGQTTSFTDYDSGAVHQAYIFPGVSTNQDGPLGIQVSSESSGSWAWYGSGWAPRFIDSESTCNAVYWSMELPHITLLSTFNDQQGICEYSGSYSDIANAVGLTDSLQSGSYSFPNTALYAQGSCCGGGCCECTYCGGQIENSVNVATSDAQGEVQLMIDHLLAVGPQYTSDQSCSCSCPDEGCYCGGFGNCGCPSQPSDGVNTAQQGRVDLIYGPFSDYTGQYPETPSGAAPYIQYGLSVEPPPQCTGSILNTFLSLIESSLIGLLTGGFSGAAVASVIAGAGGSVALLAVECAL